MNADRLPIDQLLEGVQIVDEQWRYTFVNATAARQLQRDAAELVGRAFADVHPGLAGSPIFAALERVMQTRRREAIVADLVLPNGEHRWFDLAIVPVPDGVCILSLDATQLRRTELDLHHAQRMEALGTLAGGVAHDFNNQLTAVLGFTQLLLDMEPGEEAALYLRAMNDAAERSAALTRQLLAFGRRQVLRIEALDVNAVIRNLEPLLHRLLGAHVELALRLRERPAVIKGDAQQLENALTNLVVNARDAMPAGGRVEITTAIEELTDEDAGQHPSMVAGRYAVLSLSDTGHGMDEATRLRAFDPFFTTKPPGKGTGLGLAMVYGIVKQMGGFIWVYSELGRGTTFRLYFPATGESVPAPAPPAAQPAAGVTADARILVVDDDAGVRQLVVQALTRRGYRVVDAGDAADARRQLREGAPPFDLILTDVILPHGSGPELVAAATARRPATRVLFMSGYSEEVVGRAGAGARLIQKPFTVRALLEAVEEVLR